MITSDLNKSLNLYRFNNSTITNTKEENAIQKSNIITQDKSNQEQLPTLTKDHIVYFTSIKSIKKINSLNRKKLVAVYGHTSADGMKTDLDSVVSSVAKSHLYKELGYHFKPYFNGKIVSTDIQYVFGRFKDRHKYKGLARIPKKLGKVNLKRVRSFWVDHNNPLQSVKHYLDVPDNKNIKILMDNINLVGVDDHHPRSKEVIFKEYIPLTFKKIGANATIITNEYKEKGVEIPRNIAGLLLSAILSDTMNFRSSTTKQVDRETALELARIVWKKIPEQELPTKIEKLSEEIFKAKDVYKDMRTQEIITDDLKDYGNGIVIGQIFPYPYEDVLKRKDEIIKAMHEYEADPEHPKKGFILMVTDPIKGLTKLLYTDKTTPLLQKGYTDFNPEGPSVFNLGQKVSRKADVQPFVT